MLAAWRNNSSRLTSRWAPSRPITGIQGSAIKFIVVIALRGCLGGALGEHPESFVVTARGDGLAKAQPAIVLHGGCRGAARGVERQPGRPGRVARHHPFGNSHQPMMEEARRRHPP